MYTPICVDPSPGEVVSDVFQHPAGEHKEIQFGVARHIAQANENPVQEKAEQFVDHIVASYVQSEKIVEASGASVDPAMESIVNASADEEVPSSVSDVPNLQNSEYAQMNSDEIAILETMLSDPLADELSTRASDLFSNAKALHDIVMNLEEDSTLCFDAHRLLVAESASLLGCARKLTKIGLRAEQDEFDTCANLFKSQHNALTQKVMNVVQAKAVMRSASQSEKQQVT